MSRKIIFKHFFSFFILIGIVFGNVLFTHKERIIDIEISKNGQMLTSVSRDGNVIVWDKWNNEYVYEITFDSTKIVSKVTLSIDNELLAVGFNNGNIDIINIKENNLITLESSHNNKVILLKFIKNNNLLSYIEGGIVKVLNVNLDLKGTSQLGKLKESDAEVVKIKINSNHRNILASIKTGKLLRWDIEEVTIAKAPSSFKDPIKDKIKEYNLDFTFGENSSNLGRATRIHRSANGYEYGTIKNISLPSKNWWNNETYNYYDFDISPDGSRIAVVTNENKVIVWNSNFNEEIKFIDGHEHRLNSIKFSSDGRYLATSSIDKLLKVWDVNSGDLIDSFELIDDWVTKITFNSNILVCGTFRGKVVKYNF